MRSAGALSRMRHTSHIPCHAQRAHLWAARHGCKRTCMLHRQSKRAIHTEKKTKDMLNMFMYRDVRNPTSQNNYSVADAWDSEEANSLKLTVCKITHTRVPKHLRHPGGAKTGDSHKTHSTMHHTLWASVLHQERTRQNKCCAPTFW